MDTETLLKPRWKRIADFPFMNESASYYGESFVIRNRLFHSKDYPAILRPMAWWEERSVDEMPEYVKHKNGSVYKHEYMLKEGSLYYNQYCGGSIYQIGLIKVDEDFNEYFPATFEEYQKQPQT